MSKVLKLSASRIKTFLSCSYLYWTKYHLKLPDMQNDGSRRGTICHSIFELLLMPKHKSYYDSIIKANSIYSSPVITRLIRLYAKKEGLGEIDNKGEDNFKMMDEMILLGLKTDFFCEGEKLEKGELEIAIDDPAYSIIGYIDKISKKDNGIYKVQDYKSSSKQDNHYIQALTYALWTKRVMNADSIVRFIYLRFPDQTLSDYSFTDEELNGFEEYLKSLYTYLNNLTEEGAKKDMAWDKGFPKKEDGFSKRLLCGFGKHPGHKNKNGQEYWVCSAKWPMYYYVRLDPDGKILESSKEPLDKKLETDTIQVRYYEGCPCHAIQ